MLDVLTLNLTPIGLAGYNDMQMRFTEMNRELMGRNSLRPMVNKYILKDFIQFMKITHDLYILLLHTNRPYTLITRPYIYISRTDNIHVYVCVIQLKLETNSCIV